MGDSMSKQKRRKEEKETEKEREREREREGVPFNVVVIGGNGVGKRMLVQQFVTNCFIDEVDPTLNYQESHLKDLRLDDGRTHHFKIVVVASFFLPQYAKQAIVDGEAFLLTYSTTSQNSFHKMKDFFNLIAKTKEEEEKEKEVWNTEGEGEGEEEEEEGVWKRKGIVGILVGTKTDLEEKREVSFQEGKLLGEEFQIPFFETNAKIGHNLNDIFITIARQILQKPSSSSFSSLPVNVKRAVS